jgi:hypothetical protein
MVYLRTVIGGAWAHLCLTLLMVLFPLLTFLAQRNPGIGRVSEEGA